MVEGNDNNQSIRRVPHLVECSNMKWSQKLIHSLNHIIELFFNVYSEYWAFLFVALEILWLSVGIDFSIKVWKKIAQRGLKK